jgi:uncharacterized protein YjiS (DUF1127 family)
MLKFLINKYQSWKNYNKTVRELSRLSTRELKDIGIQRGDIEFVARKSEISRYY